MMPVPPVPDAAALDDRTHTKPLVDTNRGDS
jgi:hypothetical protein